MDFKREEILFIREEILPLLRAHYEEIAWNKEKIPLAPDWKRYSAMEALGKFVAFTARKEGRLVGYAAYFIDSHLHYRHTVFAHNDVIYIRPDERGVGRHFIKWCEGELKTRGAQVHGLHIKKWFDWSALAVRMGFTPMDTVLMKWIE